MDREYEETKEYAVRIASHMYSVNILLLLLEIQAITEEEFIRIRNRNAEFYGVCTKNCIKK